MILRARNVFGTFQSCSKFGSGIHRTNQFVRMNSAKMNRVVQWMMLSALSTTEATSL